MDRLLVLAALGGVLLVAIFVKRLMRSRGGRAFLATVAALLLFGGGVIGLEHAEDEARRQDDQLRSSAAVIEYLHRVSSAPTPAARASLRCPDSRGSSRYCDCLPADRYREGDRRAPTTDGRRCLTREGVRWEMSTEVSSLRIAKRSRGDAATVWTAASVFLAVVIAGWLGILLAQVSASISRLAIAAGATALSVALGAAAQLARPPNVDVGPSLALAAQHRVDDAFGAPEEALPAASAPPGASAAGAAAVGAPTAPATSADAPRGEPPTRDDELVADRSVPSAPIWRCEGGRHALRGVALEGWAVVIRERCSLTCERCTFAHRARDTVTVSGRLTMVDGSISAAQHAAITVGGRAEVELRGVEVRSASAALVASGRARVQLSSAQIHGMPSLSLSERVKVRAYASFAHGFMHCAQRDRIRDDTGNLRAGGASPGCF